MIQATLLSRLTINFTEVIPPRYFLRSKMNNTDQNFHSKLYLNVSYYLHYIFFAIVSIHYYSPYFQKIRTTVHSLPFCSSPLFIWSLRMSNLSSSEQHSLFEKIKLPWFTISSTCTTLLFAKTKDEEILTPVYHLDKVKCIWHKKQMENRTFI